MAPKTIIRLPVTATHLLKDHFYIPSIVIDLKSAFLRPAKLQTKAQQTPLERSPFHNTYTGPKCPNSTPSKPPPELVKPHAAHLRYYGWPTASLHKTRGSSCSNVDLGCDGASSLGRFGGSVGETMRPARRDWGDQVGFRAS